MLLCDTRQLCSHSNTYALLNLTVHIDWPSSQHEAIPAWQGCQLAHGHITRSDASPNIAAAVLVN